MNLVVSYRINDVKMFFLFTVSKLRNKCVLWCLYVKHIDILIPFILMISWTVWDIATLLNTFLHYCLDSWITFYLLTSRLLWIKPLHVTNRFLAFRLAKDFLLLLWPKLCVLTIVLRLDNIVKWRGERNKYRRPWRRSLWLRCSSCFITSQA